MARRDDKRYADRGSAWVEEVGWGCTIVIVAAVLIEATRRGDVEIGAALFVLLIIFIAAVLWLRPYQHSR